MKKFKCIMNNSIGIVGLKEGSVLSISDIKAIAKANNWEFSETKTLNTAIYVLIDNVKANGGYLDAAAISIPFVKAAFIEEFASNDTASDNCVDVSGLTKEQIESINKTIKDYKRQPFTKLIMNEHIEAKDVKDFLKYLKCEIEKRFFIDLNGTFKELGVLIF